MKFNHLNVPSHWEHYWSRYPEGHTILEALIQWVSQVDDMIDNQNKLNDNVEKFRNEIDEFIARFDKRLQNEVTNTLRDWQQSGFLDVVINEALDTKYHEMDNRLTTQMAQANLEALEGKLSGMGKGVTPQKGVITLVTDDGRLQDMTIFKDMFNSYDLPVSTAITPNRIINNEQFGDIYLTKEQLLDLQNNHNWEIVSHTWNHDRLTELSDNELDETLKKSRDWMIANGFKGYDFLMYPFGLYDERVKRFTAKYYKGARITAGVRGSVNNPFPIDSYTLSTRFISETVSMEILEADINRAIDKNEWLILFFHSWEIDDWNKEQFFEELLSIVKQKQQAGQVEVLNFQEVFDNYGNILDQTSYLEETDDHFVVQNNGKVSSNIGRTKWLPYNSVTPESPVTDYPANYISLCNVTNAKGFPATGTLVSTYFTPNEAEPTNQRYLHQTLYSYNSTTIYRRTFTSSGWSAFTKNSEPGYQVVTGSLIDGTTPPSAFDSGKVSEHSISDGKSGFPTSYGGNLMTHKLSTSHAFWWQEFKQISSNNSWRRYAISTSGWSDWVKTFPMT